MAAKWLREAITPWTDPGNWELRTRTVISYGTSIGGDERVTNGPQKYRWYLKNDETIRSNDWLIRMPPSPAKEIASRLKNCEEVMDFLRLMYLYGYFTNHENCILPDEVMAALREDDSHTGALIKGEIVMRLKIAIGLIA